jgi:hypothetical protein
VWVRSCSWVSQERLRKIKEVKLKENLVLMLTERNLNKRLRYIHVEERGGGGGGGGGRNRNSSVLMKKPGVTLTCDDFLKLRGPFPRTESRPITDSVARSIYKFCHRSNV